ncbi:MAG: porin [Bacteroides sp.]|jgi:phosphate-selective porin OprO/OprP|nr:porin [Bacteroides sp.]
MNKLSKLLIVCLLLSFSAVAYGQVRNVTGVVTSEVDGSPVADVQVTVNDSDITAKTNAAGRFTIGVPENSSLVLLFNHPDYEEEMVILGGRTQVELALASSIRYNQYGARVKRDPLFPEERNGILVLENKDQDYRIWFDARINADGAAFFGDTYNEIGNGTSLRRARFAVKSQFSKNWYGEFDIDVSNSELEMKDAYLEYNNLKGLEFKVGHYKEVFSMERATSSRYTQFIERPNVTNAISPSRTIGIGLSYNRNWFLGYTGLHFQKVDDLEERLFSKDANKDFGVDEGYSLTGKFVAMPWYDDLTKGLHFALAGSYRTPKTSAEVIGSTRFDTRSLSSINRKKYIDTDDITSVDFTLLGNVEIAGYYKNFRFQSEFMMADVNRLDDLPTEQFNGFFMQGAVMLFGGNYVYNTGEGEFTQSVRGKEWGDIDIAFRYDYLSLNSRGEGNIMGGAGEGYTFGLNYYANHNVKISLNYAYLNHDRYATGKNKLFVGYNEAGELTTNGMSVVDPEGTAGEDFHMIAVRFEVAF